MQMRMADDDDFCVSDEEFWETLAGNDTITEGLVKEQDCMLRTRPYKFDFGKHRGLTFDEVPVAYIDWLVQNELNFDRKNFRAALDEYRVRKKRKYSHCHQQVQMPSASVHSLQLDYHQVLRF